MVGERKAKASFKLPALGQPFSMCAWTALLIIHFREVSWCEEARHASSWFP